MKREYSNHTRGNIPKRDTLHVDSDTENIFKKIMQEIIFGPKLTEEDYSLQSRNNTATDIRKRRRKLYGHINSFSPAKLKIIIWVKSIIP